MPKNSEKEPSFHLFNGAWNTQGAAMRHFRNRFAFPVSSMTF